MNFENLAKILGAFVALGTLAYTVYEYLDTRRLEARRPLLEVQFKLYQEAVAVTGRLATVECAKADGECIAEYERDCKRFRSLYWGGLAVVEDTRVEQAMIAFRARFKEKHPQLCEPNSISAVAISPKPPGNLIALASLDLAHCVNASLESGWGVELLPDRCNFSEEPSWWDRIFGDTIKE